MALFNTQKTRSKTSQITFTIVILVIVAIACACMFAAGIMSFGEKTIISGDDVDHSAFDTSNVYYLDDMVFIGEYAYYWENSEDNPTEHYYLVAFMDDASETVYYASLEVKHSADIMELCEKYTEYVESETEEYMDTTLKGVFNCNSLDSQSKDLREEYSLAYGYCNEEIPGIDTGLHFIYEAADEITYQNDAKTDAIVLTAVGGVMTVLCIVGLLFSFRQRKKAKEDLARLASVSAAAATDSTVSAE